MSKKIALLPGFMLIWSLFWMAELTYFIPGIPLGRFNTNTVVKIKIELTKCTFEK